MRIPYALLADISETLDSPNTGHYEMYPGGTPLEEVRRAPEAKATIILQEFSTQKTAEFISEVWGHKVVKLPYPVGITNTDLFLKTISEITGQPIPKELEDERGRVVDAIIDSYSYFHGKRVDLVGDPDLLLGLISFLLEVGAVPVHILCTNGDENFEAKAYELLQREPLFGGEGKVYIRRDLWHLRSLLFIEPVDLLIGNSYCKFL